MGKGKFIPRDNWVTQLRSGAGPRRKSALGQEGEEVLQGDRPGPQSLSMTFASLAAMAAPLNVSYLEVLPLNNVNTNNCDNNNCSSAEPVFSIF